MSQLYSRSQRAFQDRFDSRRLADALEERVLRPALAPMDRKFIAASDCFFLSTVDADGFPTVSYKGGDRGFVTVVDDRTLAFPSYDGNGMFYSVGNIADTARVGMLFIDFVRPRRLRLHGTATVAEDDPLLAGYPEALLLVRVRLERIFTNCARYIHRHQRLAASEYVPRDGRQTPVPDWKRVDYLQDALPARDRETARAAGKVMTEAEYRRDFWAGLDGDEG
jgi:predicted pyridoxine 5'-phosphate oxidase superfamily flavin-nucleotide-binding protein